MSNIHKNENICIKRISLTSYWFFISVQFLELLHEILSLPKKQKKTIHMLKLKKDNFLSNCRYSKILSNKKNRY